jgi:hypothetical protein
MISSEVGVFITRPLVNFEGGVSEFMIDRLGLYDSAGRCGLILSDGDRLGEAAGGLVSKP